MDMEEGRKDKKGGKTRREGGHKWRKDAKGVMGGRTQRERGHEGRKCDRWWSETLDKSHQLKPTSQ